MLQPFGVEQFLYTGRNKIASELENGAKFQTFEELLGKSDFVIVTCALTPDTKDKFNKEAFELMKPTSVLVNTSRGGVINQNDLIFALENGKIAMAGLDVMVPEPIPIDHRLTKLKNCVLIPHIGSATIQTRTKMATLTAENLIQGIQNLPMPAQLC